MPAVKYEDGDGFEDQLNGLYSSVMHSMRNFRGVLNKPVNRYFAATLIGVVAVVLPVYAFYDMDWGDAEFNAMSVLIPLLYVVFVAGFVFLALDKKGRNLTSVETDKKIAITYSSFQKKLTPVWWVLAVAWLLWVAYFALELK